MSLGSEDVQVQDTSDDKIPGLLEDGSLALALFCSRVDSSSASADSEDIDLEFRHECNQRSHLLARISLRTDPGAVKFKPGQLYNISVSPAGSDSA